MKRTKLLIIGGGTMGQAILSRLISQRTVRRPDITVVERNVRRSLELRRRYRIAVQNGLEARMVRDATVILLAVKPQDADSVFEELRGTLQPSSVVISIMAGVRLATLIGRMKHGRTIRAMPNLPATVGMGMTAWVAGRACTHGDRRLARNIFSAIGQTLQVKSDDTLDRITAISGSGPGYVLAFADALVQAAKNLGFSNAEALLLVQQTLTGSAALLRASADEPKILVQRVASKHGTTEAALKVLQKAHFLQLWQCAVRAAYTRARQLSKKT